MSMGAGFWRHGMGAGVTTRASRCRLVPDAMLKRYPAPNKIRAMPREARPMILVEAREGGSVRRCVGMSIYLCGGVIGTVVFYRMIRFQVRGFRF